MDTEPRKRGRPPGSRNRPKVPRLVPPSTVALEDYRYCDPEALVARQLSMLDWAQQAMRNEMKRAMGETGEWVTFEDVQKLEKLSNSIVRAIEALKRSTDIASELAARLTPEQLLEAAIKKIEGQDLATIDHAIKRLRKHRELLAPKDGYAIISQGGKATAAEMIAGLAE